MSALRSPVLRRRFATIVTRLSVLWLMTALASPAFAQAVLGQGLLDWLVQYILPGMGVLAVFVAVATAVFNPTLARGAVYTAMVLAVLYFVAQQGGSLMTRLKQ